MMLRTLLPALIALALAAPAAAQAPAAAPAAPPAVGIVEDPCPGRTRANALQVDWANLCRYRAENANLRHPASKRPLVIFMGDSITENWRAYDGAFFEQNNYVGRGISGQTTPQMLVRFMPDVIAHRPAAVHIMAGTNDIAGNTGPTTYEAVQHNLAAMATLAKAHGIKVILAAVPPAYDFPWRPGMQPGPKVAALNAWIRDYAAREGHVFVDYAPVLADEKGGVKAALGPDGIHPNLQGYQAMAPLAQAAIQRALHK